MLLYQIIAQQIRLRRLAVTDRTVPADTVRDAPEIYSGEKNMERTANITASRKTPLLIIFLVSDMRFSPFRLFL